LGETYGLGWTAFGKLLQDWRDKGALDGLVLTPEQGAEQRIEPEAEPGCAPTVAAE
jgi:hypothetical protein